MECMREDVESQAEAIITYKDYGENSKKNKL